MVDLFCGAGGLSYGFRKQGFSVRAGVDVDEKCRYAYEYNVRAAFLKKDVGELSPDELNNLFVKGARRVLVGCAPCQPFSTYNQNNEDSQWQLLERFGCLIAGSKPDVVSMENVPRLLGFKSGKLFQSFVGELRKNDYSVTYDILYGPDYGLAQTRSRLVLLASRLGEIGLPARTHTQSMHRSVRDEIKGLPAISHGHTDQDDSLHKASGLSDTNEQRIIASVPGGTWRDWHDDLVNTCHKAKSGRNYAAVYGRMEWDKPSPTLTTQFYGFGNGRFGHPEQNRALSLREGAMLQGFPRAYRFVPPGEKPQFKAIGRMIGNAVPVTLAQAIAGAVKNHLEEYVA